MTNIINKITDTIDKNLRTLLYNDQTNSYWSFLENKTNIKRERMALGLVGLLSIYLIFGWHNDVLCNLIGFVYPVYAS